MVVVAQVRIAKLGIVWGQFSHLQYRGLRARQGFRARQTARKVLLAVDPNHNPRLGQGMKKKNRRCIEEQDPLLQAYGSHDREWISFGTLDPPTKHLKFRLIYFLALSRVFPHKRLAYYGYSGLIISGLFPFLHKPQACYNYFRLNHYLVCFLLAKRIRLITVISRQNRSGLPHFRHKLFGSLCNTFGLSFSGLILFGINFLAYQEIFSAYHFLA